MSRVTIHVFTSRFHQCHVDIITLSVLVYGKDTDSTYEETLALLLLLEDESEKDDRSGVGGTL